MSFPGKKTAGKGTASGGNRERRGPLSMPPKTLRETGTPIENMDTTTGKRTHGFHGTGRMDPEKTSAPLLAAARASITLEAAVVLPLAMFALLSIISLFTVLRIQVKVQEIIEQSLDEAALGAAAGLTGGELADIGSFVWLETRIRTGMADLENVSGVSLLGTDIDDEDDMIRLVVSYRVKTPAALLPSPSFYMTQVGCRRLWTGAEPSGAAGSEPSQIVYVTERGSVYHLSRDCPHLIQHTTSLTTAELQSARSADGAIYYACSSCHPDETDHDGIFYVGTYGNRYHSTLACPQLRITVYPRRLEEVGGLPCCADCAAAWGR